MGLNAKLTPGIRLVLSILHYFGENFTSIQSKKNSNLGQNTMAGSDLKLICQPENPQAPLYVDRRSLCEKKHS